MTGEAPNRATDTPRWAPPAKYGYAEAVTMAGSVAAPLLAGFSVTLLGIVIASGSHIRFPGLAALLLALAAILLLYAVQAAFYARVWQVAPTDLEVWFPNKDPRTFADLVELQKNHKRNHGKWASRFRWSYNAGLVLLLFGIAASLTPPGQHGGAARWIAAVAVAAAALIEILWACWGE